MKRLSDGNYRAFPPLPEMREKWLVRHPWWMAFVDPEADWSEPIDERVDRSGWLERPGPVVERAEE